MPDLLAEHFIRDLSEAEQAELAQELQASPEAAERFAQLAAQDWKSLGLAEPVFRRLRLPRPLQLWGGLALVAIGAWAVLSDERPAPKPRWVEESISYSYLDGRNHAGGSGGRQDPSRALRPLPGEQLEVIARPGTDKIFTLQLLHARALVEAADVYDEEGRRVNALKSTDTREWGWSWNGRDSQGSLAKPGRYELRLQRPNGRLSRWVQVELR